MVAVTSKVWRLRLQTIVTTTWLKCYGFPKCSNWEDVVLVNPLEAVRIMVKYDQFEGTFVWHCHTFSNTKK